MAMSIIACAPSSSSADPQHPAMINVGDEPESYVAAMRMIRDELRGIDSVRTSGSFTALARRTNRIATLANGVPGLASVTPGGVADSARGDVDRACQDIAAAAIELRNAAARRDTARVSLEASRIEAQVARLEAQAPKQYVCPMRCEGYKVYDRPGICPECHMDLQLVTSDHYSVEVTPERPLRAGVPTTLWIQIRDPQGQDVESLEIVHEKLLHLMMVSKDLSWFEHVHPIRAKGTRFKLRCTFPAGGTYVLYHDFTPPQVGMQVVPVEITVEGPERAPVPLAVDADRPKRIDGYEVALSHTGLALGAECALTFTLNRHGKPVTDLEPFLGAMGHLVLISEDRVAYVHSHPPAERTGKGPRIEFNMVFSRTGLYRGWGQFQRHGRVITAPFVVEVSLDGHSRRHGTGAPETAR